VLAASSTMLHGVQEMIDIIEKLKEALEEARYEANLLRGWVPRELCKRADTELAMWRAQYPRKGKDSYTANRGEIRWCRPPLSRADPHSSHSV
jgi:hypothetical protein